MAKVLFKNNASTTLAQAVDAADLQILLTPGTGDRFPSIGSGNWFYVTVVDILTGGYEVMRATDRLTDALDVERGIDGSIPRSFAAGDIVELRLATSALNDIYWANFGDAAFGVPILDADGKIKVAQFPPEMLTETEADLLYVREDSVGEIDGVAELDATGIVPDAQLPGDILRDADKDVANGVAGLDAGSKILDAQIPAAIARDAELALVYATIADPTTSGTHAHDGTLVIQAGEARGKLTVSTAAPSGSGNEGDEWYQVEP